MQKETIATPAFENGYYMGKNGQAPWKNASQAYKKGYEEGENFRRLKAKGQADKIINQMMGGN